MWYRSLYWRIGLGFLALLATLLLIQALLVIWLTGEPESLLPLRSPAHLADDVASDLSVALARNPNLSLERYVREQFGHLRQLFGVVMIDGRVAANRDAPLPPGLVRAARARLRGGGRVPEWPRPSDGARSRGPGETPGPDRPLGEGAVASPGVRPPERAQAAGGAASSGTGQVGSDRGPAPPRASGSSDRAVTPGEGGRASDGGASGRPWFPGQPPQGIAAPPGTRPFGRMWPLDAMGPSTESVIAASAPIEVGGQHIGLVAIASRGPQLWIVLREFGPMLGAVGLGLLIVGTAVGSLLIFRPARLRMRRLEDAAAALGAGRTSVRAPEEGHDEVAALARAFNRMARALEESDAARRRLLADVSHELRTPLTAVRGYVETLTMDDVALEPETKRRYLRIVKEETEKLETIVRDLLDLARLEAGGGAFSPGVVPVERLFARVADRHERALCQKHIELKTEIGPGAELVWGDQDRLEQVFQNLAANAVRHTPDGGRIELAARPDGARVRLTVRDTGPGIPPEHLDRIFDRFHKVDAARSAADTDTGSGLGLSIARAIVARHGGTIQAANAADGGAILEVVLDRPDTGQNGPNPAGGGK